MISEAAGHHDWRITDASQCHPLRGWSATSFVGTLFGAVRQTSAAVESNVVSPGVVVMSPVLKSMAVTIVWVYDDQRDDVGPNANISVVSVLTERAGTYHYPDVGIPVAA